MGERGLMTAEQLIELPEDGWRHELIDGRLTTFPYATLPEGLVAGAVAALVGQHVATNHLGECVAGGTGFLLQRDPDTVRAPDFAFTSAARIDGPPDPGYSETVPDLVLEVVAPTDRFGEVNRKARQWVDAGVRLVWVVDPETEVVTVHRPGNVGTLLQGREAELSGEDVLPGLTVRLGDIFG